MSLLIAICSALTHACVEVVNFAWWLANSNFVLAISGAFAGAYGAHLIATHTEKRRRQLQEINDTGRALSLLHSISNAYLALKEQSVVDLKAKYDEQCRAHALTVDAAIAAHQAPVVHFDADLHTLGTVFVPIEALRILIFEKIGSNRATVFTVSLIQAVQGAELSIQQRNELVARWRSMGDDTLPYMYFGLPNAGGDIDTRYRDLIEAISYQVDTVIYFSHAVGTILHAHGERFRRRFGKDAPTLPIVDIADDATERFARLMPDSAIFSSFERQLKAWADMDAKAGFPWPK